MTDGNRLTLSMRWSILRSNRGFWAFGQCIWTPFGRYLDRALSCIWTKPAACTLAILSTPGPCWQHGGLGFCDRHSPSWWGRTSSWPATTAQIHLTKNVAQRRSQSYPHFSKPHKKILRVGANVGRYLLKLSSGNLVIVFS